MDKNELTALRAEYLKNNKETIDYVLNALDAVLKTKVLSGSTEIAITREDVSNCIIRYKENKAREIGVSFSELSYAFGISVDYKDILKRYESKLESGGIKVFRNTVTDLSFSYDGKGSLSDLVKEMIDNRDIMYLTVEVEDTEKELL